MQAAAAHRGGDPSKRLFQVALAQTHFLVDRAPALAIFVLATVRPTLPGKEGAPRKVQRQATLAI